LGKKNLKKKKVLDSGTAAQPPAAAGIFKPSSCSSFPFPVFFREKGEHLALEREVKEAYEGVDRFHPFISAS